MSFVHSGNAQPSIDREEHTHIGDGDGIGAKRITQAPTAIKVTVSGSITYVAIAEPGTAQSAAKWQVKKIDETTGTVITWAASNANFDNIATDLTVSGVS